MNEKKEINEDLISKTRELFIKELEDSLAIYGPTWVNKEICLKLIEDLKNGKPTKIGGPFWGDLLDGVLCDLGIESRDGTGRYEEIWRRLES